MSGNKTPNTPGGFPQLTGLSIGQIGDVVKDNVLAQAQAKRRITPTVQPTTGNPQQKPAAIPAKPPLQLQKKAVQKKENPFDRIFQELVSSAEGMATVKETLKTLTNEVEHLREKTQKQEGEINDLRKSVVNVLAQVTDINAQFTALKAESHPAEPGKRKAPEKAADTHVIHWQNAATNFHENSLLDSGVLGDQTTKSAPIRMRNGSLVVGPIEGSEVMRLLMGRLSALTAWKEETGFIFNGDFTHKDLLDALSILPSVEPYVYSDKANKDGPFYIVMAVEPEQYDILEGESGFSINDCLRKEEEFKKYGDVHYDLMVKSVIPLLLLHLAGMRSDFSLVLGSLCEHKGQVELSRPLVIPRFVRSTGTKKPLLLNSAGKHTGRSDVLERRVHAALGATVTSFIEWAKENSLTLKKGFPKGALEGRVENLQDVFDSLNNLAPEVPDGKGEEEHVKKAPAAKKRRAETTAQEPVVIQDDDDDAEGFVVDDDDDNEEAFSNSVDWDTHYAKLDALRAGHVAKK